MVPRAKERFLRVFIPSSTGRIFTGISLGKGDCMARHKYMTSPPNLTGMPPGVPYIIGNEAAERFSYYGMNAILPVFLPRSFLDKSGVLAPMNDNESYMYTPLFVYMYDSLSFIGASTPDLSRKERGRKTGRIAFMP